MKFMGVDWKFLTGTCLALAALAVAIYYPQVELNGRSLAIHLVSSSAIEAPPDSKVNDLRVTVNGIPIESPYISSLLLINNGEKPIMSSDFESPLTLSTRNNSTLITAQIKGSEPADINVKTQIEEGKLKISPFLSNPNDQVQITLVSSGPLDLEAKARIAGVKRITYEDKTAPASESVRAVFSSVLLFLSVAMYAFYFLVAGTTPGIRVGLGVRLLTVICLACGATVFGERVFVFFGAGTGGFTAIAFVFALACFFGFFLRGRHIRKYG